MLTLLQFLQIKEVQNKQKQHFTNFFILVGTETIIQYYGTAHMNGHSFIKKLNSDLKFTMEIGTANKLTTTLHSKPIYILTQISIQSNLQHECQTRATQVRHERHECDTSDTSATRVTHERQEWDTSVSRVLHERHECDTTEKT